MRAYVVKQSTEHQKWDSTMGRAAFYDQPFLRYEGFCKISCAVFRANKNTQI